MNAGIRFTALAGALVIAATACGGSGSASGATGDVVVTLKDFSITTSVASFPAGNITFGIQNDGPSTHELVIIRTNDAPDTLPVSNGAIPEDTIELVDEAEDIAPSTSTSLNVHFDAGSYVLVCNLPAHYEAGMRAAFTVA